jgi:hypothetical protein
VNICALLLKQLHFASRMNTFIVEKYKDIDLDRPQSGIASAYVFRGVDSTTPTFNLAHGVVSSTEKRISNAFAWYIELED